MAPQRGLTKQSHPWESNQIGSDPPTRINQAESLLQLLGSDHPMRINQAWSLLSIHGHKDRPTQINQARSIYSMVPQSGLTKQGHRCTNATWCYQTNTQPTSHLHTYDLQHEHIHHPFLYFPSRFQSIVSNYYYKHPSPRSTPILKYMQLLNASLSTLVLIRLLGDY